ncbi:SDR family oxidoreductase [Burkholderia sp. 567]|uniref:SDR family oxidoreductase n=1 Tax=Burkholderia sp. 567 TaxID=3156413 RepID=UPI00339B1FFC
MNDNGFPQGRHSYSAAAAGSGVAATTHRVDVTDPAQIDAVFAAAIAARGRVHSVVWAAGPFVNQRHIGDMTHDDWRRAIEVETVGFFNAVKAVLPHFRASGGGSFVTLGSAGHAGGRSPLG